MKIPKLITHIMIFKVSFYYSKKGILFGSMTDKAELARIGRYYATESMLWLNPETNRYDAEGTPSTGTDTLFDHYRAVIAGEVKTDLGDHAVF